MAAPIYQFLGWDKEQWEIANAVASCIGAFGTLAAVVVSLWLAQRKVGLSLTVIADVRTILEPGASMPSMVAPPRRRFVAVTVTNTGTRPAKIISIGWRFGEGKTTQHFVQLHPRDRYSSPMPTTLQDGERAQWFIPIEDWFPRWEEFLGDKWETLLPTFKVVATTTHGEPFTAPIDDAMRERLAERCRRANGAPSEGS